MCSLSPQRSASVWQTLPKEVSEPIFDSEFVQHRIVLHNRLVLYSCSVVPSWSHMRTCKHVVQHSLNEFQHAVRNPYSQYDQELCPIVSSKIHDCHYQDATARWVHPRRALFLCCRLRAHQPGRIVRRAAASGDDQIEVESKRYGFW